jgi:predicted esterase
MGFSAGAMLALHLIGNEDQGSPGAPDTVERMRNRVDFAVLVYGAPVSTDLPSLGKDSPPCCLVHAKDDPKAKFSNVRKLLSQLQKAEVPCTPLFYDDGGHGYGIEPATGAVKTWPQDCLAWLAQQGIP